MIDPRSIRRANKAARQQNPTQGGFSQGGQAFNQNGLSPVVTQYSQWNQGRNQGSLPRPASVFTDGTFTPLTPIIGPGINTPNDEGLTDPRRYTVPVGWNMPIGEPGSEGTKLANFTTLRQISDLYSVANACIDLRISEMRGLDWDIVPTEDAEKSMRNSVSAHSDFQQRKQKLMRFFKRPDSDYADFGSWFAACLYDLLQVDALSLYLWPTKMKGKGVLGSDLAELALIDGTTIRPMRDVYGGVPKPPFVAYQQYQYGVPRTDLMTVPDPELLTDDILDPDGEQGQLQARYRSNQLLYLPYVTRRFTPYGFPPVERALIPVMAGLQRQQYQLDFFTEGTIPGMFVSPGDPNMTFDQMRTLQDALNALAGDPAWKHKIIVLPPGSDVQPQKPIDLATQFDEVIMTQICMAFGVMPMELGISPKVSLTTDKSTATMMSQASEDVNIRKAMKPLLKFLKDTIFDNVIQNICGQADMEWHWEGVEQGKDEMAEIEMIKEKISIGLMSVDEGRMELGHNPWGLPITSDPVYSTPQGLIPLGAIDPTTGKPIGDQPSTFADETGQNQGPAGGKPDGDGTQPKPKPKPTAADVARPAANATPGHAGSNTGAAEADRQVGSKPGAGSGKDSTKFALAELDSLRRRLKSGKSIDDWECRHIPEGVLDSMRYSLSMGEAPLEVIAKARQSVVTELHPQRQRRDDVLSETQSSVASGLGKLAEELRAGRIAAPQFVDKGVKEMACGLAGAMRAGAAHAMDDRGHPHTIGKSTFDHLSRKVAKIWDDKAVETAEEGRHFLENLTRAVSTTADVSTLGARLALYGAQAQAAYERAFGITSIASASVEADFSRGGGDTLDDGTAVEPGQQIITWHTTDSECGLCAERDEQEYTLDTLPGWPGDGFFGDLCEGGPNCNCFLTYDDGARGDNTIRTEGYAAQRAGEAADQAQRLQDYKEVRQAFVDSLPDAAQARAQARDDARQQLAEEMGAHQGFTAWPQDVAASDVRDRVLGTN